MGNRIFVGGLPWAAGESELRTHFEACGEITDAVVVMDRDSGRSKGFGFVSFETDEAAANAIDNFRTSIIRTPIESPERQLSIGTRIRFARKLSIKFVRPVNSW